MGVVDQAKLDAWMGVKGACADIPCCVKSGTYTKETPDRCNAEENCMYQNATERIPAGCYYHGYICGEDCDEAVSMNVIGKPCTAVNGTAAQAAFCHQHCSYSGSFIGGHAPVCRFH